MLRLAEGVMLNLTIHTYPSLPTILLRVTPTTNRNSYRVAKLVGVLTQGSVLRPQPWAGESQLHYLSAPHCAAPVTVGSELLLLAEGQLRGKSINRYFYDRLK